MRAPVGFSEKDRHMVIDFGRWRLIPVDALNWELAHWHAPTKGKNAGSEQWNRLGRYYSAPTVPNALLFAANEELKQKDTDAAHTIMDALAEYRAIVESMTADVAASMKGATC